uniref:Exocyst complex component 1-like n=1 Tax=Erpetoichthys calabaricus TaxID=27687 RepID=A0A8C4SIB0_ERPCA
MASIRNCLQREIFTPKEERLLGTIQVWKAGKRRKTSILCATVSSECPVQVSLVKVKISDRGQYKPCIYWTLRNMQLVDGRDAVKETCEFHLHLDKVYKWVTNTCKEKYSFLICLWKLNQRYLQNKIKFVNINPEILEDFVPETQDPEIGETGESDRQEEYERYQELLTKETTDLEKLMEQCEQAVADSEAFVQMLMTDLQVLDQANLKEIINSEKQVHLIVQLIEEALKESEHLEKQLCAHEELLHTVKEHMDNIHQLQIIDRNHQKLYEEVIYLVENLTLAEEHAWILNNGNLDEPKDLDLCIKAVQALSCCTSTNLTAGHRKLQAVAEQLIKFESLRQNFENRFVNHINKIIVLQGMDQDFILESDIDSLILMSHSARHRKLMSCKPLMEWLKNNNPVIFNDLLMVYSESLGKLYERQLKEFFSLARFKVTGAKDSRRFSFPDTTERSLPPSSNITWPKLNFSVPDRLEMDIGRRQLVDKVLEQVLSQLEHMCIEEQEFIIYFFNVESTEDESELTVNANDCVARGHRDSFDDRKDKASNLLIRGVFGCIEADMLNFVNLCDKVELFSCLHVLLRISQHVNKIQKNPSASFFCKVLRICLLQAKHNFHQLTEAQRKDIENAKIAKKAKVGVLPFVSRLQEFLILTENVFRNAEEPRDLNDAYCKLITATFNTIENLSSQSLKTPSQVVMIENFYFIFSFLSELKIPGLDHKRKEAKKKYTHYLNLYVTSNLGLPLEKLSEFFEGVKTRMAQGIKEEEVGFQMAYNKQELRRVIERYPGKEVRKSLETLYKNNFKHLSDPYLLQVVWRMMQDDFIRQYQQFVELIERCYPGSGITMEFTVEDLLKYFSELDCSDVS